MKQTVRYLIMAAAVLMGLAVAAHAHTQGPKGPGKWQERMRSERIAFLTAETGMTPEEAQKFWPLYNEAEKARNEAFGKTMKAYGELEQAVNDSKSAKEIEAKLNAYLNASKAGQEIDSNYAKKYLKVLSAEKVARLYVAEEKFRRNQIGRLGGGNGEANPNNRGNKKAN